MTICPAPATPAEPITDHRGFARLGFAAITLAFGGFGVWAASAPLDSATIAPAKVAVEGDRKPIQHLEGGIVREILVKDAESVEEGQVLFRLEPTQAKANAGTLKTQIETATAVEARLTAERDGARDIVFPAALAKTATAEVVVLLAEQRRQFSERRRALETQVNLVKARMQQNQRDLQGRKARLASSRARLQSLDAEMKQLSGLAAKGYFPRNKLNALQRDKLALEGDIGAAEGDIERMTEAAEEARLQIEQIAERNREEVTQQLVETRAKLSDARQRLAVAEDVLQRVDVRAPKAGVVLALKVHGTGAVVAPGATLAEIVPRGDKLVLQARLSTLHVQNVSGGQKAEVRFPAFSSRTTPTIYGQVEAVSADAMQDEASREPYYQTRVVIDRNALPRHVAEKLVPGMPAEVMIATGERTALEFLLGPLRSRLSAAMREK